MLKLDSLSKNFGGLPALSEVSFQLQAGEMAFLTGHSGAGKSTLLSWDDFKFRVGLADQDFSKNALKRVR